MIIPKDLVVGGLAVFSLCLFRMASKFTQKGVDGLVRDQRGSIYSEYVILLGTVGLTVGLALYALGIPLARSYYLTKLFVLLPIP